MISWMFGYMWRDLATKSPQIFCMTGKMRGNLFVCIVLLLYCNMRTRTIFPQEKKNEENENVTSPLHHLSDFGNFPQFLLFSRLTCVCEWGEISICFEKHKKQRWRQHENIFSEIEYFLLFLLLTIFVLNAEHFLNSNAF